jgi:shikimate kinase
MSIEKPLNIILAGFMGTGKTSVGLALAEKLGWDFADTDEIIKKRAGKTISRIFAEDGEPHFRQMESEVARELSRFRNHVIAVGGGLVMKKENRLALKEAGFLVCLTAEPVEIWNRIKDDDGRPLLQKPDPLAEIKRLLDERNEAYNDSGKRFDTSNLQIEEMVSSIIELSGL